MIYGTNRILISTPEMFSVSDVDALLCCWWLLSLPLFGFEGFLDAGASRIQSFLLERFKITVAAKPHSKAPVFTGCSLK